MSNTSAPPTLDELRAAASDACSNVTLEQLIGYKNGDESKHSGSDADDVIVVHRRPARKSNKTRKDEFAQQYHRNCFYQFRNLCDTQQSFFGIKYDAESGSAAPKHENFKKN